MACGNEMLSTWRGYGFVSYLFYLLPVLLSVIHIHEPFTLDWARQLDCVQSVTHERSNDHWRDSSVGRATD
jgi:hypothetical protein